MKFRAGRPARLLLLTVPLALYSTASAQGPIVRAVLFFSPTCPHCHKVISEDLPGIFERHGGAGKVWYDTSVPREELAFFQVHNGQLEVMLVDISLPPGNALYRAAIDGLQIPDDRLGVPTLVIGETVLVGSFEIPSQLPGLIERALGAGGLDWPAIDGVRQAALPIPGQPLAAGEASPEEDAGAEAADAADSVPRPDSPPADQPLAGADSNSSVADQPAGDPQVERQHAPPVAAAAAEDGSPSEPRSRSERERPAATEATARPDAGDTAAPAGADPVASAEEPAGAEEATEPIPAAVPGVESELDAIAGRKPTIMQLYRRDPVGNGASVVVLIGMLVSLLVVGVLWRSPAEPPALGPAVPLVALVGIAVATYLTYVESSGATAVCGPVGDCNAVQGSEYAKLFGVVPVGVLGLLAYVAVIAVWLVARRGSGARASWAALSLLAITVMGTLFSIYLTFLEPFVIGATCVWCLASAIVITLLMLLAVRPGKSAWGNIRAR